MDDVEFYRRTHAILRTYRRDHPRFLSQHQLESFDDFIERRLPDIARSMEWVMVKDDVIVRVFVGGRAGDRVFLDRPTMVTPATPTSAAVTRVLYPNEARLKGLTYASTLYADIEIEYTVGKGMKGMKGGAEGEEGAEEKEEGEPSAAAQVDGTNGTKPVVGSSRGRKRGTGPGITGPGITDPGATVIVRTFPAHPIGVIPIMLHSRMCPLRALPAAERTAAGECPHDQGGYFVVGGREKVVIAQEEFAVNRLFFKQTEEVVGADGRPASDHVSHRAFLRCLPDVGSSFPKVVSFSVLGASCPDRRLIRAVRVQIPDVFVNGLLPASGKRDIPLFVLFRALGVESDRDIVSLVMGPEGEGGDGAREMLRACALDAAMPGPIRPGGIPPPIFTQAAALTALAAGTRHGARNGSWDDVKRILEDEFLPNTTVADARGGEGFAAKALYLAYLARRVVRVVLGSERPDDRDNFINRRTQLAGALVGDLFRDLWLAFRRSSLDLLDQEYEYNSRSARTVTTLVTPVNLKRIFSSATITKGILTSFRGAWGAGGKGLSGASQGTGDFDRDGIVQELARVSYFSYASHVRRVTQRDPGVKQVEPRKLLPAQWGAICPIETPDGGSIGLVKHLAVMCHVVTAPHDTRPLLAHLGAVGLLEVDPGARLRLTRDGGRAAPDRGGGGAAAAVLILVNDSPRGSTREPALLVRYLRHLRRAGHALMGRYTSVFWDVPAGQIKVQADAGRCCRPLYILHPGTEFLPVLSAPEEGRLTWESLLTEVADVAKVAATSRDDVDRAIAEAPLSRIEYIDTQETMNTLVATTAAEIDRAGTRHTHCEIHAATALSAVTGTLPLMNHQNAAYTMLSLAQTKQAIGVFATNYAARLDTLSMILHYPQRPLVGTLVADWMFGGNLAHGENLVVAVMCFTGYNQDDGFVVNQDSVDRGMFCVTQFETHTFEESEDPGSGVRVMFADPGRVEAQGHVVVRSRSREERQQDGGKGAGGIHLDARGLPLPGSVLGDGDVFVGRVEVTSALSSSASSDANAPAVRGSSSATDELVFDEAAAALRRAKANGGARGGGPETRAYRDVSDVMDRPQGGVVVVDRVYVRPLDGEQDEGADGGPRLAKVCVRQTRSPQIGDKLASRFAQKGTIGLMVRACDMPFGHASGLVPDIVINPNAFPKRMTVGHLIEALLSKRCAAAGNRCNADTFEPREDWAAPTTCALETHSGLHRLGEEVMYCGRTGEQLDCDTFLALNYMGRLKHMSEDKINSRAGGGPVAALTRQPTKGRAAHGGLRVGEMEQQCMLAHGASGTLKEAFMERSDAVTHVVDTRTGVSAAVVNPALGLVRAVDGVRTGHRDFVETRVPHSLRLLQHELSAMAVDTRLMTRD